MIAYCGLNCKACDALLATQANDNAMREKTAQKWSRLYGAAIRADQINCQGCKSDGQKFFHCADCQIRSCCLSKNLPHCAACDQYVCPTLAGFVKLAPEAGKALEALRETV